MLYDRVYQQYLNEGQELYNRLNAVNNQDNIDYSRYRDSVNDYYNDLNYYAGRYDSSYNQDFGAYQTDFNTGAACSCGWIAAVYGRSVCSLGK